MVGLPYDTFVPVTRPKKYQRCEGILGAKMYAVRKCNSAKKSVDSSTPQNLFWDI